MADLKISQMTDGGQVQDSDSLPAVRSGSNYKINLSGRALKSPAVTEHTDDYTLVLADSGTFHEFNKSTEVFLEVPDEADVDFEVGTQILLKQVGLGKITITHSTAVTVDTPETLSSAKQYAVVGIYKSGADLWTAFGNLEAA